MADDLVATGPLRTKSKKRKARSDEEPEKSYVDSQSSRKILKIGQELQEEEDEELKAGLPNPAFAFDSRLGGGSGSDSKEELDRRKYEDEDAWGSEEEGTVEAVELDPQDMDLFNKFNPTKAEDSILQPSVNRDTEVAESTNLADLILEKIAAHEAGESSGPAIQGGGAPEDAVEIPPKVVEVYTKYVTSAVLGVK